MMQGPHPRNKHLFNLSNTHQVREKEDDRPSTIENWGLWKGRDNPPKIQHTHNLPTGAQDPRVCSRWSAQDVPGTCRADNTQVQ